MLGTGPPPHHIIQQRSPHPIRKYVEKVASQDLDDYPDWDLTVMSSRLISTSYYYKIFAVLCEDLFVDHLVC